MLSLRIVLVGTVLAGCGGARHGGQPPPDFTVARCPDPNPKGTIIPFDHPCSGAACGPNSPVLNSFPVNGVSDIGDGKCNAEGVQLIPHSLHGGGCGFGRELGIQNGQLVGRSGPGDHSTPVCSGAQMVGASFIVRSFTGATLELSITEVRQTTSFGNIAGREAYRIEADSKPACHPKVAAKIREHLGLPALPSYAVDGVTETLGPNSDLIIPVEHPIYDFDIQPNTTTSEFWNEFNLACADDALAKLELYQLKDLTNATSNLSALHMLTATYCSRKNHYTIHGIDMDFTHPADPKQLPREARWQSGKADCLDLPRLRYFMEKNNFVPDKLPPALKPSCPTGNCTYASAADWATAVANECGLSVCTGNGSGDDFESRIIDATKFQVQKKPLTPP